VGWSTLNILNSLEKEPTLKSKHVFSSTSFLFWGLYHQNPVFFCFPIFIYVYVYIYIEMAPKQLQRGNISEIRTGPNHQWLQRSQRAACTNGRQLRSMNPLASALRVETRQVRFVGFPPLVRNPWVPSHGDESGIFPGTWKHHKNQPNGMEYFTVIHEQPYIYRCMKHVDIQSYCLIFAGVVVSCFCQQKTHTII